MLLTGCSSKLIEHPGLRAIFVWDDTGLPIANTKVVYAHITTDRTMEAVTASDGSVFFPPTFTRGYAGYPTSPVSLQVRWKLLLYEKHNPSESGLFVNNTDVDNAVIDAGTIRIAAVFRKN